MAQSCKTLAVIKTLKSIFGYSEKFILKPSCLFGLTCRILKTNFLENLGQ